MSALRKLAKMLGVGEHQAEDAMHSERAAKASLSRRNLLAAAGALAAGTVFVPVQQVLPAWTWSMMVVRIGGHPIPIQREIARVFGGGPFFTDAWKLASEQAGAGL
jgi:hypothetical protein